ncbi:glycosyltransferase [Virgibacillus dakarensis]|uniref:glycosyltransferase n=1 Tax=Virgibacillus dakarensis TaxID=1917889 RepID=UPI000B43A1B0|nr:glycosyltransferase [Virgibacillus dakarensis]
MKIILVGLATRFTEGMTYQDNLLANQLRTDGNEVIVISDCYKYDNGSVVKTEEEDRILDNGIRLIRMEYRNILGGFISNKVRAVNGLYEFLEKEKPDIVFHHGVQSYELLTVANYKKDHPKVKFFVDNHADFHNSATNFFSKYILHKTFYRYIIQISLPYIDKVFYIGYDGPVFLKKIYNVPNDMMEFYPLGGIVPTEKERREKRQEIRNSLRLKEDEVLLVHTGKMDKLKRTVEILETFIQVPSERLRLVLIGSLSDDIKETVENLVLSDKRISFLGWKNANQLFKYLCASDLYLQPGSKSATMQNALCCGSAVAIYPYQSYEYYLNKETVFYIRTTNDMKDVFESISIDPRQLDGKRKASGKIVRETLDYKVLASRLYR